MADKETSNHFQANFEENAEKNSNAEDNHNINNNLRDLPECPVCLEEIKIIPIFECTNGHVICSDCIPKLQKCPICRNESMPVRSSKSEEVILEIVGLQSENMLEKSQNLTWGLGSKSNIENNVRGIETISSSVRIEIEDRYEAIQELWSIWSRADKIEVIICIIILLSFFGLFIIFIYDAAVPPTSRVLFFRESSPAQWIWGHP